MRDRVAVTQIHAGDVCRGRAFLGVSRMNANKKVVFWIDKMETIKKNIGISRASASLTAMLSENILTIPNEAFINIALNL